MQNLTVFLIVCAQNFLETLGPRDGAGLTPYEQDIPPRVLSHQISSL